MDKIFHHLDDLHLYLKNGDTLAPITVEIDPTNACQQRCPRCSTEYIYDYANKQNPGGTSFTPEILLNLLHELSDMGTKSIVFTGGGEPMVFRNFPKIVSKAAGLGLDIGIKTNGALIKNEHVEDLLCAEWIRISLDAGTAETYKKTHGVDDFHNVCRAIELLSEAKRSTTIGIAFLIGNGTEDELEQGARIAKDSGADYIQFRPFDNWRGSQVVEEEVQRLQETMNSEKFLVVFPNTSRLGSYEKYSTCHAVNFTPKVGADLIVYACCARRDEAVILGNLMTNSFAEIWRSKRDILKDLDLDRCLDICRHHPRNKLICDIIDGFDKKDKNFI